MTSGRAPYTTGLSCRMKNVMPQCPLHIIMGMPGLCRCCHCMLHRRAGVYQWISTLSKQYMFRTQIPNYMLISKSMIPTSIVSAAILYIRVRVIFDIMQWFALCLSPLRNLYVSLPRSTQMGHSWRKSPTQWVQHMQWTTPCHEGKEPDRIHALKLKPTRRLV